MATSIRSIDLNFDYANEMIGSTFGLWRAWGEFFALFVACPCLFWNFKTKKFEIFVALHLYTFLGDMYSRCCLLAPLGRCFGEKPCCSSILLFCGAWFRALVLSAMDKLKLKCKGIFCNIGCLGCCKKTSGIVSMDDASKGLRTQCQTATKEDGSEYLWSSSTFELDHSAAQSRRSISSTGISNNPSDPQSSSGSQSDPHEFVNHGFLLWNQIRQQWVGNKRSENLQEVREPRISSIATYDSLLGNNKPFPQPIPLREMVDFLVDIWEQDGLYD
ncbi:hypothetical protein VNO77_30390 [Canavalia gladiata]|uniref:Gag1-like clamp domain-containing protein n=1 Tax=Canavalia gladiata TaxID=3824 RepID=A0AAN9Q485_CANGL